MRYEGVAAFARCLLSVGGSGIICRVETWGDMVDPTDRLLVCCSDGAILSPVFGVVKEVGLWHGGINGDLLVVHVSYVLL